MSRLVGCPGSGQLPATEPAINGRPVVDVYPGGKVICSRCGGLYAIRADGRLRAHRVPEADVVPMIAGRRYTSGVIRSERRA